MRLGLRNMRVNPMRERLKIEIEIDEVEIETEEGEIEVEIEIDEGEIETEEGDIEVEIDRWGLRILMKLRTKRVEFQSCLGWH